MNSCLVYTKTVRQYNPKVDYFCQIYSCNDKIAKDIRSLSSQSVRAEKTLSTILSMFSMY